MAADDSLSINTYPQWVLPLVNELLGKRLPTESNKIYTLVRGQKALVIHLLSYNPVTVMWNYQIKVLEEGKGELYHHCHIVEGTYAKEQLFSLIRSIGKEYLE